ncbi:MAG: type I DNA topoisomerase [Bacteroidales bacterium]|nr:type I DNA topoisomerase [Bacteroidales bacterium]
MEGTKSSANAAKNLVIVESPGKIHTIQKVLGNDYLVMASYGHIRDLDEKKLGIDIEAGFKPDYQVPADKIKRVAELKKAAQKAQTVWLASDDDREGEAISWHLFETLGLDPAKTKRIAFHEITKDAILKAIENPRDIDMNLVNAQQARRVLDRLVGFELSPVLWRKVQPKLSAGRVQSVALRLIVDREKEIMEFEGKPYYKVDGVFHPEGSPAATKTKGTLDTKFEDGESARKFLEDSADATFTVDSIETKEGTRFPAAPFTTSTLQQEAGRKLHFPVVTTMRVAQALYERGLITYMRTDSTNLSALAIGTAKKYIVENFGENYHHARQFKTKSKGAQEAHEAIRPTFIETTAIEGTAQEQKLYSLIWKRTVASQMEEARVLNTSVKVASDKRSEKFNLQSSQVIFDGFLKVYMEGTDDEVEEGEITLPEMHVGDIMNRKTISAECKFTQAPARYSQPALVKKLEELGIGRPSTYGPTVQTLTTGRGYVATGDKEGRKIDVKNYLLKGSDISESVKAETIGAEKGKLLPQEIGMIVTDYLVANFHDILDYNFTADVEKDFDQIAEGEKVWNGVISEFYSPFHAKVKEALEDRNFSKVTREIGVDPADGQMIIAKFGAFGPFVQKGDGENKQYASLAKGQLIESITLEDALKLFQLPRRVGEVDGIEVIALKGKYGPYLKYGEKNVKLPKGNDPLNITIEECAALIKEAQNATPASTVLAEFGDIQVIKGMYGPYIKCNGSNYKIAKGTDPSTLTEEACRAIIDNSEPTAKGKRRFKRK